MQSPTGFKRLSGRHTLIALLALYLATLVGLGCAIWFEWPAVIRPVLLVATLLLAVLAAICAGSTAAETQDSMNIRERSSTSAREVGVFTLVALAGLAVACAYLITPRSWPTSVAAALTMLDAQLSEEDKKKLAYMGYDDLGGLRDEWATAIPRRFGMLDGNDRLLRDCDPEYTHPDFCSSVILSRFWKRVRAELPPAERAPLEALELRMERVRFKHHEFEQLPLRDVVAFFNEAIRTQLAAEAQFTIHFDPRHADEPVTASWHETVPISLREALAYVAAGAQLRVRKAPPDLLLERK